MTKETLIKNIISQRCFKMINAGSIRKNVWKMFKIADFYKEIKDV